MVYIQMTFSAVIHMVLFVAKSEVCLWVFFFLSFVSFIFHCLFFFSFSFFFCSLITITYEGVNPDMP